MKIRFLWLALLALPLTAATSKKPGEAASIGEVEIQGDAKPGGNVVAIVHVKLEKDWHLQSNKPSEPNFIPTKLALGPTEGVKASTIKYPAGESEKVAGLDKRLSVYREDFKINVLLTLKQNARLPLIIPAVLSYQACQGATCYPPKRLKFDIPVGTSSTKK